jgi:hypothetical protein
MGACVMLIFSVFSAFNETGKLTKIHQRQKRKLGNKNDFNSHWYLDVTTGKTLKILKTTNTRPERTDC